MKIFWNEIIRPLLAQLSPKHIVEVGSDYGHNTKNLLEFCRENGSSLTSIDPHPKYDVTTYQRNYSDIFYHVQDMSLSGLKKIDYADVILIDGDHNWYTVYHELKEIDTKGDKRFPLIIFHDTGWPYGRRDMYYDPNNIPKEFLQENQVNGVIPGKSELFTKGGFNHHLHHAVKEGGARNGVLTAIEDYVHDSDTDFMLQSFEGLNGISFLYRNDDKFINNLLSSLNIEKRLNKLVEEERIKLSVINIKERIEKEGIVENKMLVEKELEEKIEENKQVFHDMANLKLQVGHYKSLAESLRLKSRFKKLVINAIRPFNLVKKGVRSLKEEGARTTYIKSKYYLSGYITKPISNSKTTPSPYSMDQIREFVLKKDKIKLPYSPLVSIIILNRDGLHHLKRLFYSLKKNTYYKNYELIIVDNASTDGSIEFIEQQSIISAVRIIKNDVNVSFSEGNNQAVKIAKGMYLVLLNNDVEPLFGWLSNLMYTMASDSKIMSVGAQLIYPHQEGALNSCFIQHAGISFKKEQLIEPQNRSFYRPVNVWNGGIPILNKPIDFNMERVAVTAACLLISKAHYIELGGLDILYKYGYEDVDLGLKINQRGYKNVWCPNAILFHYESSTQLKEKDTLIKDRRLSNIDTLYKNWNSYIEPNYLYEFINNTSELYCQSKTKIAFAVTDAGPDVAAGDYFTALELAGALEKSGFECSFVTRKNESWYNLDKDIDILISMLDSLDLYKLKYSGDSLIKIAWIRNWPHRWLENPSLKSYDILYASSKILCNLIEDNAGLVVECMPIATNSERFNRQVNMDEANTSDVVFSGNYWGKEREIQKYLDPNKVNFDFHVYGKGWGAVPKLEKYHKGFLAYKDMPKAYANTKIVIDDAVEGITKPFGSVNSRVFDAIASGALVITNGDIGAEELFGGFLPTFTNGEEMHRQIDHYLQNESQRISLVKKLQEIVFRRHTYRLRSDQIKGSLKRRLKIKQRIAIKIPSPTWHEAESWGDYHLARGLKKYFERQGYCVILQVLSEWYDKTDDYDVAIVLRGLSKYTLNPRHINIMWNISHPDKVTIKEYNRYDKVFVASKKWCDFLSDKIKTPVELMYQCTDPEEFFPDQDEEGHYNQLLFVGNSRKVNRRIIKDLLPTNYKLAIYGRDWESFVDTAKYVKGSYIPNRELNGYYASAEILLNDHWDSMRENGFISNRIFDGLAAKAFIISDNVEGLQEILPSCVEVYRDRADLNSKIDRYLACKSLSNSYREKGFFLVTKYHTFENRVDQFIHSFSVLTESQ